MSYLCDIYVVAIQLSVEGKVESKFAENNLGREVYKSEDMKYIRSALIDMCRQNMDSQFERELDDEIRLLNATDDEFDGKSLEYHYDLYETVKTFNDYLCIVYLNLANILTYPNETFYEKYEKKQIKIKPDDALKMANKICQSMQKQFEDIIVENFPIKETAERITKVEKNMPSFDTDEIVETKKKTTKVIKKKVIRELDLKKPNVIIIYLDVIFFMSPVVSLSSMSSFSISNPAIFLAS